MDKAEEKRRGGRVDKRRGGGGRDATEGSLRQRLPQILKECAERLKVLRAVHRRVINRCARSISGSLMWCFKFFLLPSCLSLTGSSRFHSFLLFLGYSRAMVRDTKAEDFCKTISDFSLEYRTTRQAFLLQRDRERRKGAAESPGAEAPVGRRKRQQTPTQVAAP